MYPCLKQGDSLHIEPCFVENAKVGDIAIIRRNGALLGHRIISKGVDDGRGPFIVTCPDRNAHGDDGPTWQNEFLGIVSDAKRKGRALQLEPQKLHRFDLVKVSLWEWWNWHTKTTISRHLGFIQQQWPYRILASAFMHLLYSEPEVSVCVPLKPMQKADLCQVFPAAGFNLSTVQQKGKAVAEWSLQLELQKKIPAAWITFVRQPDSCPEGGGWRVGRSWTRIRYRGAGLEARLMEEARKIFSRSGESFPR